MMGNCFLFCLGKNQSHASQSFRVSFAFIRNGNRKNQLLSCRQRFVSRIQDDFSKIFRNMGSRLRVISSYDAVARVRASHLCGPSSIPGLGVISGLNLLLVLILVPRDFSPGTPVFPSPKKLKFDLDYC